MRGSMKSWSSGLFLLLLCCLAGKTVGSAIPMWEFLTRDEKMSHLYRIFSKQVARYCSESSLPDCNKNLLVNGIRSLANMNDNQLDEIDPYQRDAKYTIWRAMIGEKRLTKSNFDNEDQDYTADPLALSGSDHNRLGEESAHVNDYVRPSEHTGPYLMGPMVIRVFPDGRPVPGDAQRPLPGDEDVDELKYPKIPSLAEIEATASADRFSPSYLHQRTVKHRSPAHYRRPIKPLFRDSRISDEINANVRPIRFY